MYSNIELAIRFATLKKRFLTSIYAPSEKMTKTNRD